MVEIAEAQSSRSLDWPVPALSDRDRHRPQGIPCTRLRSQPMPVRSPGLPPEPRTACPARSATQPLARQTADHATRVEFWGVRFLAASSELSPPRSPYETVLSCRPH